MAELNSRRDLVKQQVTNLDYAEINQDLHKEEKRMQRKLDKRKDLEENSLSYGAVRWIAKVMDDYYLDAILGFIPGGIGDAITSTLVFPSIYVSLFKIHSIPLTLAVISRALLDTCIGCIPFLGNICDIFYKSNKKNYQLIRGFVEDDKETIDKVNRQAVWMLIFIVLLGVLIYYLIIGIGKLWTWLVG